MAREPRQLAREGLRRMERRLYATLRHSRADDLTVARVVPWNRGMLQGQRYCLLVSFRHDGTPVPTPVWFAEWGDGLVIRSAATDGKVMRIQHDPHVRIAPCSAIGRPLGPSMLGTACILEDETDEAEASLQYALGLGRQIYTRVRDPLLDAAYIQVTPDRGG